VDEVKFSKHPLQWFSRKRLAEAECLRAKIARKAATDGKQDEEELLCYLKHRFEEPLVKYGRRGPLYGRAFTFLSITVVAAGFGSSAISVAQDNPTEFLRWAVFGLGVLVSLFTAINQLWKPGLRSVGSYRAGNSLRREGWNFVFNRGPYRKAEGNEAFDLFIDQIGDIQSQVDAIDEVQAEVTGNPGDAGQEQAPKESSWRRLLGL
jgi:hypothetical protein